MSYSFSLENFLTPIAASLRNNSASVFLLALCVCASMFPSPTKAQALDPSISDPVETAIAARRVLEWQSRAKTGDADALFRLGEAYRIGAGVPEDRRRSAAYLKRAAERGHVDAMTALGSVYYFSESPIKDVELALQWWREGARRRDARAQYLLALLYYNGGPVAQDLSRAYGWMLRAREAGLVEAQSGERQLREQVGNQARLEAEAWANSETGLPADFPPSEIEQSEFRENDGNLLANRYIVYSNDTDGNSADSAGETTGASRQPVVEWRPISGAVFSTLPEVVSPDSVISTHFAGAHAFPARLPLFSELGPAVIPSGRYDLGDGALTISTSAVSGATQLEPGDDASVPQTSALAEISPGAGPQTRLDGTLWIQLAALATPAAAEDYLTRTLRMVASPLEVLNHRFEPTSTPTGNTLYRVQVGPFKDMRSAEIACSQLKTAGSDCIIVNP